MGEQVARIDSRVSARTSAALSEGKSVYDEKGGLGQLYEARGE